MKPLELARDRSAVRFLVGSLLGCFRRCPRRFAVSYRVSAAALRPMIFCGVIITLLGKDRKPGIVCSRFFVGGSIVSAVACLIFCFVDVDKEFSGLVFSVHVLPILLLRVVGGGWCFLLRMF